MSIESLSVTIRPARERDAAALERLAALDSATVPAPPMLVAEVGGALVAAVGISSGEVVADPFVPTSEILELLDTRARRLHPRPGLGWRALLRRGPRTRAHAWLERRARRPDGAGGHLR